MTFVPAGSGRSTRISRSVWRTGDFVAISVTSASPTRCRGLPTAELERRLIELGFVEGAAVEILHEGIIGRDPIAVRVNNATIALRRREAMAILVR